MTTVAGTPAVSAAFYAQLGDNIAAARYAAGLTQQELAAAVGMSRQSICMFENGRQRVLVDTLLAIAAATGVGIDTLLEGVDS